MPERAGLEFTGERVVPGLVDADLLNEHLARYRFAARFASGASVLDAGCGTGYGAAELLRASKVVGVDASFEAVDHARMNFSRAGVHFLQAVCESLPFADGSFDLVTAFEVIEHLERWQDFLAEARRVLLPAGVLLVSTPNKAYYAEARGEAGANPYHVREFEYREFESILSAVFPHVRLWTQNHSDAIVFNRAAASAGELDVPGDERPEQAHFFLAACSESPIRESRTFAWSPRSGNVLRDREHHITLLKSDLEQTHAGHAALQASHEKLLAELERSNEWAGRLNAELTQAGTAIAGLQQELAATHAGYRERVRSIEEDLESTRAGYREKVRQLEVELAERLDWVHSIEDQSARLERALIERTQSLAESETQLRLAADSKWVRLGRQLHLGPEIVTGSGQPE